MFIPFTVYANIVPGRTHNKRRTYIKSMENIAKYIATDIADYLESSEDFNINEVPSVSYTPQFAQYSARVTITGWDIVDTNNFQTASKLTVDAPYTDADDDSYDGTPGKTVEGYVGTQYLHPEQSLSASPDIHAYMSALKTNLETASSYLNDITRIDYMGITFGKGGYSF